VTQFRFIAGLTVAALALVSADAVAQSRQPWSVQASGEWAFPTKDYGELEGGATLSISQARYRDGMVLTFALRTEFAAGDNGSTIDVIELDCAAGRSRSISASTTRRNGEMTESNEPGAFEIYPAGSVMAQIAVPLCEQATRG